MIAVCAGHHQDAQGATFEGHTEWPEAVLWRDRLVGVLGEGLALTVPSGLLRDKVEFINASQAVCAIEIHFNSAMMHGKPVGRGCETLQYPGSVRGGELAYCVHKVLARHFPPDRGVKEGWYRMDYPGRVDYDGDVEGDEKLDYFLVKTHCPAIIIEPEFIHLWADIERKRAVTCLGMATALTTLMDRWGVY